jgi:hypothetical protein
MSGDVSREDFRIEADELSRYHRGDMHFVVHHYSISSLNLHSFTGLVAYVLK